MKQDTFIVILKALAYVLIGTFTPWTAALAQWINSGGWPEKIIWVGVILPASVIGGATSLLAFLNGSYGRYVKGRQQPSKIEPIL